MKQKLHDAFHAIKYSRRRWLRTTIGVALVVAGGLAGFLPVLGYWMVPLGLVLLGVDWPWARRLNEYAQHRYKDWRDRLRARLNR